MEKIDLEPTKIIFKDEDKNNLFEVIGLYVTEHQTDRCSLECCGLDFDASLLPLTKYISIVNDSICLDETVQVKNVCSERAYVIENNIIHVVSIEEIRKRLFKPIKSV